MSTDLNNHNNQSPNNEEVDLIRLLNYFKNGVKSFFRGIWKIIEAFILFVVLLKKNWILVVSLILIGVAYGWYIKQSGSSKVKFEMVVRSNPLSNIELYSFADEVKNHSETSSKIKKIGISNMHIEAVEKAEDIISNYFNQIEATSFRGDQTDTLYFKAFDINSHKSNMDKYDFTFQKIKFQANAKSNPKVIQGEFLNYINNLPGIKREQESKLTALTNYEKELKRNISNIDSLLGARVIANKNVSNATSDQVMVNTASRGNVEADLLRYSEVYIRKLYGTQKMIAENQKGVDVISDLKLVRDNNGLDNPILKYSLIGFLLSCLLILFIQFNKYLDKFSTKKNL